jgi:cellobiose-specific phosphotransferase system component IIC
VNTFRRTLGWIGGLIMITIFVIAMLAFWPFVRRTELELKDEADDN